MRRMFSPITVLSVPQRMFSIVTSAMPNGPSRMRIISPVIMFFTNASSSSGIGSVRRRSISLQISCKASCVTSVPTCAATAK